MVAEYHTIAHLAYPNQLCPGKHICARTLQNALVLQQQMAIRLAEEGLQAAMDGASNDMDTLCCRGTMNGRTQQAVYATNKVQKPQELVAIVDEQNNVIGQATRQEMRLQNAIHRCSFTIVSNSKVVVAIQLCLPALVQELPCASCMYLFTLSGSPSLPCSGCTCLRLCTAVPSISLDLVSYALNVQAAGSGICPEKGLFQGNVPRLL